MATGPSLLGEVPMAWLRSWQRCPSWEEGKLLPRNPQPWCFGELEVAQCSVPHALAAMACTRLCVAGAHTLPGRSLLADGAAVTAGEVLFPTGLWTTHWKPALSLLLFSMALGRRCFQSPPCPSDLSPQLATQPVAGRPGRMQDLETSPPASYWIGIGWWTEE